jgi:hypothetical protein
MGKIVEEFTDMGYVRDEKTATNIQEMILLSCTLNAAGVDVLR